MPPPPPNRRPNKSVTSALTNHAAGPTTFAPFVKPHPLSMSEVNSEASVTLPMTADVVSDALSTSLSPPTPASNGLVQFPTGNEEASRLPLLSTPLDSAVSGAPRMHPHFANPCPFKPRDHRVEAMFELKDGRELMTSSQVFSHYTGQADDVHLQALRDPTSPGGPKSSSGTNTQNRMPSVNFADFMGWVSESPSRAYAAVELATDAVLDYLRETVDHDIKREHVWARFEPGEVRSAGIGVCGRGTDSNPTLNAPRLKSSRETNPVLFRDCNWPLRVYIQVLCSPIDAGPIISSLQGLSSPLFRPNESEMSGSPPKLQPDGGSNLQEEWLLDRFTDLNKPALSQMELEVLRKMGYPKTASDVRNQQIAVRRKALDVQGVSPLEADRMALELYSRHDAENSASHHHRKSYYTRRKKVLEEKAAAEATLRREAAANATVSPQSSAGEWVWGGPILAGNGVGGAATAALSTAFEQPARECIRTRAMAVFYKLLRFLERETRRPVFEHARTDMVDVGRLRRSALQAPEDPEFDFDAVHGCNISVRVGSGGEGGFVYSVAPRKERASKRTSMFTTDVTSAVPPLSPVPVRLVDSALTQPRSPMRIRGRSTSPSRRMSPNTRLTQQFDRRHATLPSNMHVGGRCQHQFGVRSASGSGTVARGRSVSPEVSSWGRAPSSGPVLHETRVTRGGIAYDTARGRQAEHPQHSMTGFNGEVQLLGIRSRSNPRTNQHRENYRF